MATPALPDTILDPSVGGGITSAWADQLNLAIAWEMRDRPHCRVYNSANISVNNATTTALTFDSERVDVGAMHSTSSNTSRITFTDAGFYLIVGNVSFASNVTGTRRASIRLNGVTIIASVHTATSGSSVVNLIPSCLYQFVAGDYVELIVDQDSGGALNITASANYSPEFSAMWMCS